MRTPTIPNLSLIPAVVGALLQAGAQLFAIAVVVGTVTEAPPRSLAMYAGEYGYNSGPFWEVMPTVTLGLLLIALIDAELRRIGVSEALLDFDYETTKGNLFQSHAGLWCRATLIPREERHGCQANGYAIVSRI